MRASDFPPENIPEQDGVYCQGGLVCPALPALPAQDFLVWPNPGAVRLPWTPSEESVWGSAGQIPEAGTGGRRTFRQAGAAVPVVTRPRHSGPLFRQQGRAGKSAAGGRTPASGRWNQLRGGGDHGVSFNAKKEDRKYMNASHLARKLLFCETLQRCDSHIRFLSLWDSWFVKHGFSA